MDRVERVGEAYVMRKVNGIPEQVQKVAASKFREASQPSQQQMMVERAETISASDAARDNEIRRLKRELTAARAQESRTSGSSRAVVDGRSGPVVLRERDSRQDTTVKPARPASSTLKEERVSRSGRNQRSSGEISRQRDGRMAWSTPKQNRTQSRDDEKPVLVMSRQDRTKQSEPGRRRASSSSSATIPSTSYPPQRLIASRQQRDLSPESFSSESESDDTEVVTVRHKRHPRHERYMVDVVED